MSFRAVARFMIHTETNNGTLVFRYLGKNAHAGMNVRNALIVESAATCGKWVECENLRDLRWLHCLSRLIKHRLKIMLTRRAG